MLIGKGIGLLTGLCLFLSIISWGQSAKPITGNFDKIPFKEFVRVIESAASYHFYYDTTRLDSLRVTILANEITLSELLDQLFQPTIFHFAIDSENNVFIAEKRFPLLTKLPEKFFGITQKISAQADTLTDYGADLPGKKKINTSAENKLYERSKSVK